MSGGVSIFCPPLRQSHFPKERKKSPKNDRQAGESGYNKKQDRQSLTSLEPVGQNHDQDQAKNAE
jgi:hypothetical protein